MCITNYIATYVRIMNHNLTKDKVYNIVEKVFYYESFNFNFVL